MKERDQIHAFGWRKIMRMVQEKSKTVTPRLAFPFCLKTAKSKATSEKAELRFCYSGITTELPKMIPGCF